ncbi:Phosphotyrosyl phosphatase activator [Lentinula lateritia]|nr:Phosphotyrosyl phosphatase activator [Lentinula lateritia]
MVPSSPPRKCILTPAQLAWFQTSDTHKIIVDYIELLNESVIGAKLSDEVVESETVKAILAILDHVESIARDTPPVDNSSSRFGNPAFRTFYDKIAEIAPTLHTKIPSLPPEIIPEISLYFVESWGNRSRIDYGSGMEMNFLCWLLTLHKLQILSAADSKPLVLRVFWRYIRVMRLLQSTYWLEPAGSHGVWGLDDYHFLPFLWGAAQLRGHKYIRPKSIHDPEIVEEYAKEYIYFACIQFINSIKTASLRWHSPMLDDISAVKTWDKVNSGMIKMYKAEVLGKLPVMQHFLFGSIIPYEGPPPPMDADFAVDAHIGHTHPRPPLGNVGSSPTNEASGVSPRDIAGGWGDCCGIPVPSAFGAARAEQQGNIHHSNMLQMDGFGGGGGGGSGASIGLIGKGIRPVPFD